MAYILHMKWQMGLEQNSLLSTTTSAPALNVRRWWKASQAMPSSGRMRRVLLGKNMWVAQSLNPSEKQTRCLFFPWDLRFPRRCKSKLVSVLLLFGTFLWRSKCRAHLAFPPWRCGSLVVPALPTSHGRNTGKLTYMVRKHSGTSQTVTLVVHSSLFIEKMLPSYHSFTHFWE